ncbi:hypothetical protein TSOC_009207 [Tetrabaena socialis]|uniref:Uncharacterized protein n=1 Tax=Tetrabaena socialis TaxID=47790 RepID=A0A2J7ZWG2_9CHLO|nr:hypothetical protein TSOC_009207 [Tetrabaena socialis]|eukprot:PNH04610.1 hypothetical protein TSOC_009207 [Tetrabaena socialis]
MPARIAAVPLLVLLLLLPGAPGLKRNREALPLGYRDVPLEELLPLATVPTATTTATGAGASGSDGSPSSGGSTSTGSGSSSSSSGAPSWGLSDADFVFATGSCRERMHLARSTRAWRGPGIRAFILTDQNATGSLLRLNAEGAAHGESYAFFPDDGDPLLGALRHGSKQGDTRAAVAPFAAHR